MNRINSIFSAILLLLFFLPIESSALTKTENEQRLKEALSYLNDIPEVSWVEFDNNTVYVGFSELPDDWELIIKMAALNGNKATDFGCHVWATPAKQKNKPVDKRRYYGTVTARYGKVGKVTKP